MKQLLRRFAARNGSQKVEHKRKYIVGVCAMDKKVKNSPGDCTARLAGRSIQVGGQASEGGRPCAAYAAQRAQTLFSY